MGVFEWLLRRPRAAEEAPVATQPVAAEAQGTVEAGSSSANGGGTTAGTATAATATSSTEDVDIPRQQTADQAPDNEAGKGPRT